MQEPPFDLMALPASTRVDPLIQAFADYWWSKHALRDAVPDRAATTAVARRRAGMEFCVGRLDPCRSGSSP